MAKTPAPQADLQTGWFSETLINELKELLKTLYGHEHDDIELQRIGLNIAQFVYTKEVKNVQQ
jgi:hypothetical protein